MSCLKAPTWSHKRVNFLASIPRLCTVKLLGLNGGTRWSCSTQAKQKAVLQECCTVLEVELRFTESELRAAYLKKVKDHHPDKKKDGKDSSMFNKIYSAYQTLSEYKRNEAAFEEAAERAAEDDDEDEDRIRHTVPQHRQYLTNEGYGYGTPTQRGRQYQQFKVARANERVYEYRKTKYGDEEDAVVVKEKAHARKIRTSNLIQRIVDDLVRESMQRGDFDNLPGKGKPLDYSDHNPMVDTTTHNLNKIMVNNGFMPEWIMASKEIRTEISTARQKLSIIREQVGAPPYSDENKIRLDFHIEKCKTSVREVNTKINKYNMIVPFMEKQMVNYNVDLNVKNVLANHLAYLPTDEDGNPIEVEPMPPFPQNHAENSKIPWAEVWSNIKDVFKYR